jgi:hypothetical protein
MELSCTNNCLPARENPSISATLVQAISLDSCIPAPSSDDNPKSLEMAGSLITNNSSTTVDVPSHTSGIISAQDPTNETADREPTQETSDKDVAMSDAAAGTSPSSKPRDDTDLPAWLLQMIKYLCDVAEDVPWQNLVTEFVAFEKQGPPNGVSSLVSSRLHRPNHHEQNLPMKLRPQEISKWIRSKKKDIVPRVNPAAYGQCFLDWWRMMQPPWRKDSQGALIRETPKAETWQALKKGGTASIYIVVMGLSWWIKAQLAECDAEAWSAVDDILWVIKEMKKGMLLLSLVAAKRAFDGADEEPQNRKKYATCYFPLDQLVDH